MTRWIRFETITVAMLISTLPASVGAQEMADVRQMYDGTMLPGVEVTTLANSDKLFPVREVRRGSYVRPLPEASEILENVHFEANGKKYDLFDYIALNRLVGLLILKNGRVVLEDYELGVGPKTHWPSFSVAKSVSSTLVGAALLDGKIGSLDDAVTKYLPSMKGGAYEGVTLRNLLQMASGVKWDETYTDPKSDQRRLVEVRLKQEPGSILKFMSAQGRAGSPGTIWNYNTGDTVVLGAAVEVATRKPLATYLTEKIWAPWGMEADARWWVESPNGMAWAGGGIAATLRDFGRIGLFVLAEGVIDGESVVPRGWFDEAGGAKEIGGKQVDYGYSWWTLPKSDPVHDGAFEAQGLFGQRIYLNRKENVAIVVLSARPKGTGMAVVPDEAFFGAVVKALH